MKEFPSISANIDRIPNGYSEGRYGHKKYGITKTTFNDGKSFKIYGEELGGADFISLNYYITKDNDLLKPCEMPARKVIHFLENVIMESDSNSFTSMELSRDFR